MQAQVSSRTYCLKVFVEGRQERNLEKRSARGPLSRALITPLQNKPGASLLYVEASLGRKLAVMLLLFSRIATLSLCCQDRNKALRDLERLRSEATSCQNRWLGSTGSSKFFGKYALRL